MQTWKKSGLAITTLIFLSACSSGLKDTDPITEAPISEIEISPLATTVSHLVPAGTSDAEEFNNGTLYTNSNALELGYTAVDSTTPLTVGVRFSGVAVPKGASITNAYIEFEAGTTSSGAVSLKIVGQDVASGGPFANGSVGTISSRVKTSAQITWASNAWTYGQPYQTPNLSNIVQEITSRGDWQQGSAMVFIINGTGFRRAASFEHTSLAPAKLVVSYETSNAEIPTWQTRLEAELAKPNKHASHDPVKMAQSGDLYPYARNLNEALTSLTAAYRINRDPDTVSYMRNILVTMKNQLGDADGDGFNNWVFYGYQGSTAACKQAAQNGTLDASVYKHCGKDTHEMEEMLTHSGLVGAVYTLQQAGYTNEVNFWKGYFKNEFEPKWVSRNGLNHGLTHPNTQYIRYYYYMSELFNDSSYYTKAQNLAGQVRNTMRPIDGSSGYVWSHHLSQQTGCQPTVYVRLTIQAMADIAVLDSSLFSSSFMNKVAYTLANRVIKTSTGRDMAGDVCGEGILGDIWAFSKHPYGVMAPWNSSGKIENTLRAAFQENQGTNSINHNVPAAMIHSLGR